MSRFSLGDFIHVNLEKRTFFWRFDNVCEFEVFYIDTYVFIYHEDCGALVCESNICNLLFRSRCIISRKFVSAKLFENRFPFEPLTSLCKHEDFKKLQSLPVFAQEWWKILVIFVSPFGCSQRIQNFSILYLAQEVSKSVYFQLYWSFFLVNFSTMSESIGLKKPQAFFAQEGDRSVFLFNFWMGQKLPCIFFLHITS